MKILYDKLENKNKDRVKKIYNYMQNFLWSVLTLEKRVIGNRMALKKNKKRQRSEKRRLEIGPGITRIDGFETLNVRYTPTTDYVYDATKNLPFEDGTFEVVYASHIIEHVPWYHVVQVLKEWRRIIAKDGCIEIWTPDLQKIAAAALAAESNKDTEFHKDEWFKYNLNKDPMVWFNGRIFSYGDGTGARSSENWHLSGYNFRLLSDFLIEAGFSDVQQLERAEVRGYDHGWINLGVRAIA